MEEHRRLEEADKKYIWHPFTQMRDWERERPLVIDEGRGCFIRDHDGKWYLDGVSSLWVNIHGHRKREIDEAIKEQIDKISHSTLLGLSNEPAIRLAEKLVGIVEKSLGRSTIAHGSVSEMSFPLVGNPSEERLRASRSDKQDSHTYGLLSNDHLSSLSKVFYSDNGSTSVEVALKMAFQYWKHKGTKDKSSFLSLNNAYHGDTLGAVSVGGIEIFHEAFRPLLFKTFRAPSPYCYRCEVDMEYPGCAVACAEKMEEILHEHHNEIAAVIIEPIVQAAGGMIVSPPEYLKRVREACTRYGILLIADEVATGFGRTGKMFACEHESISPDILCLSKGITGGYLPLGATVATDEIYNTFLGEFRDLKTFFHGHSYTGNQLACSAGLACIEIFEREETLKGAQPLIGLLEKKLQEMSLMEHVGNVRNKGLMAGIELVKDKKTREPYEWEEKIGWRVAYYARDKGVFIRPLGNVVVIIPPLCISLEDLGMMLKVIEDGIRSVT
jgi:adenosylmethionine-8-amino-7-oxononanoate transaminase